MMTIGIEAYLPVVCVHGSFGSYKDFDDVKKELDAVQPGHPFFSLDFDNKIASMKKLQTLVDDGIEALDKVIAENKEMFSDGFILMGHSQGGIVSRAMFMQKKYNIRKYISLSGIQNGYFGHCHLGFAENITCGSATRFMYSKLVQNTFSVAGYWRTPMRDWYLEGNRFLPILNNEEGVSTSVTYQKMLKQNFLNVGEYHFFSSPDDDSVSPWFTSVFDTLDVDFKTRIPLKNQYIYTNDTFGLRTAIEQGRVHFYEVPNVEHDEWLHGRSDVWQKYLFPLFD